MAPEQTEGPLPGKLTPSPAVVPPGAVELLLAQVAAGKLKRIQPLRIPLMPGGTMGLASFGETELMTILGLGRIGAQRVLLSLELHRLLLLEQIPQRASCRTPSEVVRVMRPWVQIDHERLWCLPMDVHGRLIGSPLEISRGDVDGTEVSPRAVCRAALRVGAVRMIAVHNHPSCDPTPSDADVVVTQYLIIAGQAIGIRLDDHVIVCSDGRYTSLSLLHPDLFLPRDLGYQPSGCEAATASPSGRGDIGARSRALASPLPEAAATRGVAAGGQP